MRNKAGSRTSAPDPALFSAQLAECVPEWRLVGGASCVVYCISCAFACGLPRHKYCGDAIHPVVRLRGRARRGRIPARRSDLVRRNARMQAVDGHVRRKVGLQVRLVPKSNTRRALLRVLAGCAKSASTRCAARWRMRSPGSRSTTTTTTATGRGLRASPTATTTRSKQ